jgi:hypothetical protein
MRWLRQNCGWCWTPSQNTTSKMHLEHSRSTGNSAYMQKGTTLRVMVASKPKVSFWPDGSTSPRNDEWLFAYTSKYWVYYSNRHHFTQISMVLYEIHTTEGRIFHSRKEIRTAELDK